MKISIKIIVLLAFGFLQLISAANLNLDIKIATSKSIFIIGEPIEILLNVTNIGNIAVDLDFPRPGYRDVFYNITNLEGEILPYHGITSFPSSSDRPLKLEAGANYTELIVLNSNYGKFIGEYYTSYSILESGEYTIEVKIVHDTIASSSNILNFKVVAPRDEEEKIYESITKVFNEINLKDKESTLKSCNDLLTIIQQNPKSVYSPVILRWLPSKYEYFLKEINTSNILVEKILMEYSYSGLIQDEINFRLKQMTNVASKKGFLQKIKQVSKNSFMEKIIDQKIKEIGF